MKARMAFANGVENELRKNGSKPSPTLPFASSASHSSNASNCCGPAPRAAQILVAIAMLVAALDQLTKSLVAQVAMGHGMRLPIVGEWLVLEYTENRGA